MAAMMVALATGRWDLAIGEADDLHQDWRLLTQQVSARSIDPPGSDRAHRLLVEQTLQVIDLVAAAAQIERNSGTAYSPGSVPAATLAIVHTLPRLAWKTTLLAPGTLADGASGTAATATATDAQAQRLQIASVEASLARTLGLLEGSRQAPDGASVVATAPAIDAALLQAGATAGAATERFIALLRNTPVSTAELQAAGHAAVQAQMRLFELAHGTATAALAAQTRSAAQHRALLLGTLTCLSLIALALVAHLWRGLLLLQAREQAHADQAAAPGDGGEPLARREQGEQLFSRLRANPAVVEPVAPSPGTEPAHPPNVG
jgi:hypothetical protein